LCHVQSNRSSKILLKANIDIILKNKEGCTSFELANKFSHIDLAKQIKQLMNGNKVDDIVWIGLFDKDYLSDTVDDTDYQSNHSANRARPVSMISCILNKTKQFFSFSLSFVHLVPNFMSAPNTLSIMEEIDLKEKTPNRSTNHQRQSSDSTILNDNQMISSTNKDLVKECNLIIFNT
jgi:hypothetical protein